MDAWPAVGERDLRDDMSGSAPPHILMLVGDTITKHRRTGVQRVVIETAGALAGIAQFDLVRWDLLEGRLRFLDAQELDGVFGAGDWPPGVQVRPEARCVGRPFREMLPDPRATWLLAAEVAWHEPHGIEIMARAMAHCRGWGGRFAAVFYDLIPITNAAYAEVAGPHEAYLAELVRADLIIPISQSSGRDLARLWSERGVLPHPPITPALLPDGGFGRGRRSAGVAGRKIALFGTVEPRKRQVEFLKVMERAQRRMPELASWDVVVVGSLHGAVAAEFNALVARHDWLTYCDYVSDAALDSIIDKAAFTVFASDDEGYGLPISESLAAGVPCLCADFGSMAEIAAGGGCYAVDVRDAAAMEEALVELCTQPQTLARLRAEIAARPFQSWTDYGRRLVELMADRAAAGPPAAPVALEIAPIPLTEALDDQAFTRLADADIVSFGDAASIEAFIAEAARRQWPALLPALLLEADAVQAAGRLARERGARRETAQRERAFAKARGQIHPGWKTRPVFLRVLISTYNRADFVVANVRWILNKVLGKAGAPVDLVVVDGGSMDGTVGRLHQIKDPRLTVIECPTNVGMLAGLREAARAPGAEYVWLVGDDDFIDPAGFADMVKNLKARAGLPFAMTNFSVYHRAALSAADTADRLVLEGRPVAEGMAVDAVMPVCKIAEQTDNLFTAIYTIVWRADLLSAAFEHAFDGPPFQDLTEAIPCTEFILKAYGECDAWWSGASTVTGNAHNSWSRHRPRWHAVIMPLAFALAREAGVDPVRLQPWADLHLRLLDEALELAKGKGWTTDFGPQYAGLAQRVFRVRPPGFAAP